MGKSLTWLVVAGLALAGLAGGTQIDAGVNSPAGDRTRARAKTGTGFRSNRPPLAAAQPAVNYPGSSSRRLATLAGND